jgi:hypothetical protein
MKRNFLIYFLMLLPFALVQCRGEAPEAPPVAEKKVAPAPQPAVSEAEIDELVEKVAKLKARSDELEKMKGRVVKLEEELGYVKSGLNHLEKKPIPAPVKVEDPEEEPVEEPAEKPEEKPVEVVEPVPTGDEVKDVVEQEEGEEPDVIAGEDLSDVPVGNVELVNMKFATQLDREKRTVVEEKTTFSRTDNRLYCWLVLSNLADDETRVKLFWKHDGKVVSDIDLRVGKRTSHWRTWAYIKPHSVGQWEVELQDLSGRIVGTGAFTVE